MGDQLRGLPVEDHSAAGASVAGASAAGCSVAGASVAGCSVAGASAAGCSVAGASVAGCSVAGASVAGCSTAGATESVTVVSAWMATISLLALMFLLANALLTDTITIAAIAAKNTFFIFVNFLSVNNFFFFLRHSLKLCLYQDVVLLLRRTLVCRLLCCLLRRSLNKMQRACQNWHENVNR